MDAYQLLQVPGTDLHVALVIVEALSEVPRIGFTRRRLPARVLLLINRGSSGLDRLGGGGATELPLQHPSASYNYSFPLKPSPVAPICPHPFGSS